MTALRTLRCSVRSVLVMVVWLAPACVAFAASADFNARVTRLMEVSGINHAIAQVSPGVLAGFDTGGPRQPMPANIRAALRDAAINAAQPRQQQIPVETIKKHIADNMPQIRKQTTQFVVTAMSYTYRSLTDQEIESYIKFSRSPGGAAFNKATVAGFSEAMIDAIGRFMTAIPKAMERTKDAVGT